MDENKIIKDFINKKAIVVNPESLVSDVIKQMLKYQIDGFPVVKNGKLVGFISILDILFKNPQAKIDRYMKKPITITENFTIKEVIKLMLRKGLSKIPVVDNDKNFIGIVTHTDILRAYIERSSMEKVFKIKEIIEGIYNCKILIKEDKVKIDTLIPTQAEVNEEELECRLYEVKNSLIEPIIVLKTEDKNLLVDGHTRLVAADMLHVPELPAYILMADKKIEFGLEKTAKKLNLKSVKDIQISK